MAWVQVGGCYNLNNFTHSLSEMGVCADCLSKGHGQETLKGYQSSHSGTHSESSEQKSLSKDIIMHELTKSSTHN